MYKQIIYSCPAPDILILMKTQCCKVYLYVRTQDFLLNPKPWSAKTSSTSAQKCSARKMTYQQSLSSQQQTFVLFWNYGMKSLNHLGLPSTNDSTKALNNGTQTRLLWYEAFCVSLMWWPWWFLSGISTDAWHGSNEQVGCEKATFSHRSDLNLQQHAWTKMVLLAKLQLCLKMQHASHVDLPDQQSLHNAQHTLT